MEDQILSLAQTRGAQAEVFGSEQDRTVVEFQANEFHSQESRLTHGYGLRVVKNGRVGFSSSSDPNKVDELVQAALDTAEFGKRCSFEFPGPEPNPTVKTFENRVIMLPALKMIEWGRELVDAVRARVPGLKLDVSLARAYGETVIANSAGLKKRFSRATLQLSATGLVVSDGLVWISEYENLSSGAAPSIGVLADRIEERAILARSRARLATGTYPVIFMPTAVPDLLYPLLVGVNGKQLEKGVSPLIGKTRRSPSSTTGCATSVRRPARLMRKACHGAGTSCSTGGSSPGSCSTWRRRPPAARKPPARPAATTRPSHNPV
jgi:PmbA protein